MNFLGKKLEGDGAVEARVLSLVDNAHPAATELFENTVMREGLANHCWETALGEAC
jgi:hypothetical protein